MIARGEQSKLTEEYHKYAQILTISIIPAALVMTMFSGHLLLMWTRNVTTTASVAPLVTLLAIGTALNGLMYLPHALQVASGWTRIGVQVNAVSVVVLLPCIYFGVSAFGPFAAAVIWIVLNVGYFVLVIPLMHRKLLPTEMRRWYSQDVFAPFLAALAAEGLIWILAGSPELGNPGMSMLVLATAGMAGLLAALLATPLGRNQLKSLTQHPYFRITK